MFKKLTSPKLRIGAVALAFGAVINSAASVDARPVLSPGCAPAGPVVYNNDFEGAAGPEWSSTSVDTAPSSRRFLGQFGNDTLTLTLPCLPAHVHVSLSFDLYVIRSWDGNLSTHPISGGTIGPDVWGVRDAGGSVLLQTTFTNWLDVRQAYPSPYPGGDNAPFTGAAETNSLGYLYADQPMDAVYHLGFSFPHSTDSLSLDFYGSGLQALTDESWGIDNVRIGVVSPYLYLPLVASNYLAATPAPPTATPSSTRTPTNTPTHTPSPSRTPASSQSPSATATSTSTATGTSTATPTQTSTLTNTATSTHTSTPTGTNTPPDTPTPTPTPTANCANYSLSAASQTTSSGFPRVNFDITNSDAQDTWIQAITFTWAAYDSANPGQTLNLWRYDGSTIGTTDDPDSPTTWVNGGTLGTLDDLNIGETDTFNFDYLNLDAAWPGNVPADSFGLIVTLGNGCVLTVAAQPTPTPTVTGTPPTASAPTVFPVGIGGADVVPRQIVRTSNDRVYVFANQQYSTLLRAYWTTSAGLPNAQSDFNGSASVNVGANVISVDAVYDGGSIIHVLVNTQGGQLKDYPFDATANNFKPALTIVASGNPTVSGGYVGTCGVSGMVDQSGTLHIAYWSSGNHVTYRAYTYDSTGNTLTLITGSTQQVDAAGNANHPAMAVSPVDNSVTVAWIYGQAATDQGKVFVRTRSSSGSWDAEQQASAARAWTSLYSGINIDQGPSLVIASDGVKHLIYIENFDGTGDYGHVHYVVNSGSGWTDQALGMYTHDPGIALSSTGQFYVFGHGHPKNAIAYGGGSPCLDMKDMCYIKKSGGGAWGAPQLLVAHTGTNSFDASPSIKWGVVGWNRPETIEVVFFRITNGDYSNPTLYYARVP